MHVLILNQTFHPDTASTGQLMWDFARHLDRQGHRVTVLTSSFYYGTDRKIERGSEKIGNIEIVRVAQTGFGKKRLLGRMMDFASFYVSSFLELCRRSSPDVILALTSPPMVSTLAAFARTFFQKSDGSPIRFVYHVMDLYPDAATAPGVIKENSLPDRIFGEFTSMTLAKADATVALGRCMRDRLLRRYPRGASVEKIEVVHPWAEADSLRHLEKSENPLAKELGLVDTFNLVYSGNLGVPHDLDTFLAAIEKTKDDPSLRWIFIGGGKKYEILKREFESRLWPNLLLLPFQDREKLNFSLNLADVHLVSQLPAFTGVVVPSKLFGILAIAKPSLMVGPADAEVSRIIEENEIGYVVQNGDADVLLNRIADLRANAELRKSMGERARNVFEREYTRDVACSKLQSILERVLK